MYVVQIVQRICIALCALGAVLLVVGLFLPGPADPAQLAFDLREDPATTVSVLGGILIALTAFPLVVLRNAAWFDMLTK
jgi:hypothetical protein